MRILERHDTVTATDKKISDFLSGISRAARRVLMLDYDGTLAPFSIDPAHATPYAHMPELLRCLRQDTDTRVIIVSGRQACSAARLLGVPAIEIWGCHGLERMHADGSLETVELTAGVLEKVATASEQLKAEGLENYAEHKPGSVAIHWRGREVLAGHLTRKVMRVWSSLRDRKGLRVFSFDGGIEITIDARNKGDAVRTVLRETGTDAAVAYLGDDATDEDAFAALQGHGLNVLVREEHRKTMADVWIRPPDEVESFLMAWRAACRSGVRGLKSGDEVAVHWNLIP